MSNFNIQSFRPVSQGDPEAQIARNAAIKQRTALVFGALAGLMFAGVAWGYDSYILAISHGMYAWLPFVLGLAPCLLVGVLISWATYRINHILASFAAWLLAGLAVSWLTARVSFKVFPWVLNQLDPGIAARLDYVLYPSIEVRNILVTLAVTSLFAIAGLLSVNLIETSAESSAPIGVIMPVLIWLALFGIAGFTPRVNYNRLLSEPVARTDAWIQFAINNEGKTLPKEVATAMRIRAVEPIRDLIHRPRSLILASYDEWLSTAHVLVDFDGVPVSCWVVENSVSVCERLDP